MRKMRIVSALLAVVCLSNAILFLFSENVSADSDEAAYWRSYSSEYYYQQMNETEKAIYDIYDKTMEEILLSDEDIEYVYIDMRSLKLELNAENSSLVKMIFYVITQNNPQYFFFGAYPVETNGWVDGEEVLGSVFIDILKDFQKGEDRAKAKEEYKNLLESYVNNVPENALPEEKEKLIFDMMAERITYDFYYLPSGQMMVQNAYSALHGKTVCIGYAVLFSALMNKVGVPCIVNGNSGHAWDMINLHGYWYCVDVTDADCFDPLSYHSYNQKYGLQVPDGMYEDLCPKVDKLYDNLEESVYSSCYIHKDYGTFFIVNALDNEYGRLCKFIDAETTDVEWVACNGKAYKVVNYQDPEKKMNFSDFVERLYVVALGRDSEKEGKEFWCEHVGNGDLTGADCAREFLNSKEFTDKELTNEAFLKVLYRVFFNREAIEDPNGYNFWLNSLETVDRMTVVDGFINSEEWVGVCSSYGVRSGSKIKATKASDNAIAFATRLYTECLGRDPEQDGLDFWSLGLTNLEITGSQAAREFFYSKEFIGYGLDDKEYITRLYKTFMGRDPEEEGFNFWVKELSNGANRDELFDYFCVCPEFTKICETYSICR